MFACNYKKLRLSFNKFYNMNDNTKPEYWQLCLLELKDGRHTAGAWDPSDNGKSGKFIRGPFDSIELGEVSKWHSMAYNLSKCLEDEEINWIDNEDEVEGQYNIQIENFKSFSDGDSPKNEQYCLVILNDGTLSAGRWDEDCERFDTWGRPTIDEDEVWAWSALSSDDFFAMEEEWENERKQEEQLNSNATADPELFKYGTDITEYYSKALEKLIEKYPWATLTQMLKKTPWDIVPLHGKYVFGQVSEGYRGSKIVKEWTDGTTADEFIDFLCKYVKVPVKNSNPKTKFKYGYDIEIYLDKAYMKVKKDYHWLDKKMLKKYCRFDIQQIDDEWEFMRAWKNDKEYHVLEVSDADNFLEQVEYACQEAAVNANPVVAEYKVPFGHVEIHGWNLERYEFLKMKTGDYKVTVQAGDRVTGGTRTFFIPPKCFEAKTYGEFLDRYLGIVSESFGLTKQDLLPNAELKKFLGYSDSNES